MRITNRYGRTLLFIAALMLLAGCAAKVSETSASSAQASNGPRPKAAVYIMGNPEGRDALRMAVNTFLVKSGRYQMVAVDAIDVVAKEQQRQMSGSVSDEEIAKLGYDAGAQYVCVVERTEFDGVPYVATRMVSVESKIAEFADMVELPRGGKIIDIIQWQIGSMLGMAVGPRPAAVATTNNVPTSNATPTNTAVAQPTSAQGVVPTLSKPTEQQSGAGGVDGSGILTDSRDGKKYKTVVIGGKRWMGENLNIKTGTSWCWGDDNSYCAKYGRLYDWNTATMVCPKGWHLPSNKEWEDLVDEAVGGKGVAGRKLKSTSGWYNNGNGTDEFGFSALPGSGYPGVFFGNIGSYGYWWTATRNGSKAYHRTIRYNDTAAWMKWTSG